jgi:hypothetical protein
MVIEPGFLHALAESPKLTLPKAHCGSSQPQRFLISRNISSSP